MRKYAKIDDNQPEIVRALLSMGCSVQSLATIGGGCADLLVGYQGINVTLEVKDGKKIPSLQRLTPDETKWHAEWRGQIAIVNSTSDAMAVVLGVYRNRIKVIE